MEIKKRRTNIAHLLSTVEAKQEGLDNSCTYVGKCIRTANPPQPFTCQVSYQDEEGRLKKEWLRYLDTVKIEESDEVLLVNPMGSSAPVVMGKLASAVSQPPINLNSGHRLIVEDSAEAENGCMIRLEAPDGETAVEIHLVEKTPKIYLPAKDLSLDLEGRLRIAAKSIDLRSKLGNVNVKANDDFNVNAERIWFN